MSVVGRATRSAWPAPTPGHPGHPGHPGTLDSMIPLEEARAVVLASCPPLAPVSVALAASVGCVTAQELRALEDVPPFANSAVDGYAVRAEDTAIVPAELDVAGTIAAGAPPSIPVEPGRAVKIMTGAPVPPGADAVVMVEETEPLDGGHRVRIHRGVRAGDAVRGVGDDVHRGDLLFAAGTEVRPAVLGVLASVGHLHVPVVPKVRVSARSRPATSSSKTADRSRRGRSARATAPCSSPRWPRPAAWRSTSASCATTRTHSNGFCGAR